MVLRFPRSRHWPCTSRSMSTCVCVAEPSQFSGREAELYTVAIVVYSGRRTPTFYEATVSKHGGEGTSRFAPARTSMSLKVPISPRVNTSLYSLNISRRERAVLKQSGSYQFCGVVRRKA